MEGAIIADRPGAPETIRRTAETDRFVRDHGLAVAVRASGYEPFGLRMKAFAPRGRKALMKQVRMWIGGTRSDAHGRDVRKLINPATGDPAVYVPEGGSADGGTGCT